MDLPTWLLLLVYALAAARLTRLIVTDDIAQPVRDVIARQALRTGARGRAGSWLLSLVSCYWCAGFWASGAVVLAWWWWGDVPAVALLIVTLAVAQVQAMVNGREEPRGIDD